MLAPVPITISDDPTIRQWLGKLRDAANVSPQVIGSARLSDQGASLSSVLVVGTAPTLAHGVYRVSVQIRVTRPASVSSSIRWLATWLDGAVVTQNVGTALTGNVTTEWHSGVFLLRADAGTEIHIDTAWSSVGGTAMQFEIDAVVEAMPEQLKIP